RRLPHAVVTDEGVGEDHELAGDGDEGDLCGFSIVAQALVEGTHVGVEARGAKCREVESAAHGRASAEDDACTLTFARLIGDRSQAGEQAALFGGDAAEFAETGDQDGRGDETEAWYRSQDGVAAGGGARPRCVAWDFCA